MFNIELDNVERTFFVAQRQGLLRRDKRMIRAVSGLDFTVNEGEFVGYLGKNGAGKSTTIKILTGILRPTSGKVRVCGMDPFTERKKVAYRFGAMFGQRQQLWWDLPLVDSLDQLHLIYNVPDNTYRKRLAELVDVLDLGNFLKVPVRQLSLGQRIRGELAGAMVHHPEILFLDEPTIGLDYLARERVRDFLAQTNRDHGVTILLTTHDLADLQRMISRLIVLERGEVISDGPLSALFEKYGLERTMTVDFRDPVAPIHVDGARTVEVDGCRQVFRFMAKRISSALLIERIADQAEVVDLTVKEPDVEDLVRVIGSTSGES
jgi:ABC-2 type transport system ATP-binding protein